MNLGQMLAALLICLLAWSPSSAQQAEGRLKIFVLQGSGAYNSLRDRTVSQTVVEVRDEFNQPVRGAEVAFQLPSQGPGGHFTGQRLVWAGKTDASGQVAANSFIPNGRPGRFNIQVSATHQGQMGYAFVTQTNTLGPASDGKIRSGSRLPGWAKAALVIGGAAAAGGIVWGVRQGGGRPDVVLQPGVISLGGPR